jgi:hypothetical protein
MTAKEKAKELFDKIDTVKDEWGNYPMCFDTSKQCALIAVDEIMTALTVIHYGMQYLSAVDYWQNVKQEIEKL